MYGQLPSHAANLRSPSQSVRNPTTWFQLGVMGDAGPGISNGLGAFLYGARFKPGFALTLHSAFPESQPVEVRRSRPAC